MMMLRVRHAGEMNPSKLHGCHMLHSQRASEGEKAETRPLWVERRPVPVLVLSPGPITHCDVCDLRMRGVVWCGRVRVRVSV